MITHLRGTLVEKMPTAAIVDVGGVGYAVAVSLATFEKLPAEGEKLQVFTHHYVREDRQELFGFADRAEREVFELLIEVSGIGPNSAQTILSGMSVADLQAAIFHERISDLTAIKGIGRKTAERMVVELKDKIQLSATTTDADADDGVEAKVVEEAAMGMIALGFGPGPARQAVGKAVQKSGAQTVQQLIKLALKER